MDEASITTAAGRLPASVSLQPAFAGDPARSRRRGPRVRPRCPLSPDPPSGCRVANYIGRGLPHKGTHAFPAAGIRRRWIKKAARPSRSSRIEKFREGLARLPSHRDARVLVSRPTTKREQPDTFWVSGCSRCHAACSCDGTGSTTVSPSTLAQVMRSSRAFKLTPIWPCFSPRW
jgi:hypothetical protein